MSNTASTINFLRYQVAKITNSGLSIAENETINKYLACDEPYIMASRDDYALGFFCIGSNGYDEGVSDGSPPMTSVPSRNRRMGVLYRHMPFVMYKEADGIVVDGNIYGCRTRVIAGGIPYICYFAKKIASYTQETMARRSLFQGDTVGDTSMIMDSVKMDSTFNGTDSVSVSRSAVCHISQENIDAVKLYGEKVLGNPSYALIREIGLLAGLHEPTTLAMSNLFLAASSNVGGIIGIDTPSDINVSIGRSAMILNQ